MLIGCPKEIKNQEYRCEVNQYYYPVEPMPNHNNILLVNLYIFYLITIKKKMQVFFLNFSIFI